MSGEIHPQGEYIATIQDHGLGRAQTGTIQVTVLFQTDAGYITGWFPLTDKSAEYTTQKLTAMGFDRPSLEELNSDCLIGNECRITVAHETGPDGQERAKVRFVDPVNAPPRGVQKDRDAALAAKQFDALLKRAQEKAGIKPGQDNNDKSQDDLPF